VCNLMLQRRNTHWVQEIEGFTWPGIEYGAPPPHKYSFYEASVHTLNGEKFVHHLRDDTEKHDWQRRTMKLPCTVCASVSSNRRLCSDRRLGRNRVKRAREDSLKSAMPVNAVHRCAAAGRPAALLSNRGAVAGVVVPHPRPRRRCLPALCRGPWAGKRGCNPDDPTARL